MAQLAVVVLALMERTYTLERAGHARAVATAKGRRIGRPSVVDPHKLAYAAHLRKAGDTIAEIVAKTGITRSKPLPPPPTPPRRSDHRRWQPSGEAETRRRAAWWSPAASRSRSG